MGKVRWIGFSTHAPAHIIKQAIETDAFDYVNCKKCLCVLMLIYAHPLTPLWKQQCTITLRAPIQPQEMEMKALRATFKTFVSPRNMTWVSSLFHHMTRVVDCTHHLINCVNLPCQKWNLSSMVRIGCGITMNM